jgi:8-oxo-dGTP diphosphatase
VAKRPDKKEFGGKWEFPGGKVEPTETHEYALYREILEEFDTEIRVCDFMCNLQHSYDGKQINLNFYKAEIIKGSMTPVEHSDTMWGTKSELENTEMAEADMAFVQFILR